MPVRAMLTGVAIPLQIVAVPLITEVGLGLTVTTAEPLISEDKAVHLESVNAVTV